ncbi:unnamed protein product [Hyaloperonospora brassicae]|uniref:Uncharacterized protein n=1 Tax=Hyaloperonospora brassicae TaxID=162125 RepID=A0AAV0UU26_HYABA|nr:unnamed protein product [Hyaloperonospora brassicae]
MKKSITAAATIALAALAAAPIAAQDASPPSCTAASLTAARTACDSLADISQLKCNDGACHDALHLLTEDETRRCYTTLGLGPVTDLDPYVLLDDFCHGDGVDPADLTAQVGGTNGTNATFVGANGTLADDHNHDHDHDHTGPAASGPTSASSSAAGSTTARFLIVLQLVVALTAALTAF